jgi:protease YdgD
MKPLRHILRATLCLGLMMAPTTAPGEGSSLIRLTDRDDLFGWEAVGRLEFGNRGYCTGVLIATDLVLTAAHCVYDKQARAKRPEELTFRAGLRDGQEIATRGIKQIVAHENYDPRSTTMALSTRLDVALLKLSHPIPAALADPFKLHSGASEAAQVSVVSYGQGRDDALSWQRECSLQSQLSGIYIFDCNVTFGSSGAPVFLREDGHARIFSVVSAMSRRNGKVVSLGMELPMLVDLLKRKMRSQPSVASKGFRRVQVGQENTRASGAKFAKP